MKNIIVNTAQIMGYVIAYIVLCVIIYYFSYHFYLNLLLFFPVFHGAFMLIVFFSMVVARIFRLLGIPIAAAILLGTSAAEHNAIQQEYEKYGVTKNVMIAEKRVITSRVVIYDFLVKAVHKGEKFELRLESQNKIYANKNIGDSVKIIFSERNRNLSRLEE